MSNNYITRLLMISTLDLFSFYFAKPCKNISYDEYINAEYIILGHLTTSIFLDSILKNGIKAPEYTGNFSNKDMFIDIDKYYIYLAGHFDRVFSENAVKKFGGKEILILIKVKRNTLELDDLNGMYSKQGISLTSNEEIHNVLTQNLFSQCRTKESILPEQIIEVFDVNKIMNTKLFSEESFVNMKPLTFIDLKKNIDINLLKWINT